jgi:hypothetical protein
LGLPDAGAELEKFYCLYLDLGQEGAKVEMGLYIVLDDIEKGISHC